MLLTESAAQEIVGGFSVMNVYDVIRAPAYH